VGLLLRHCPWTQRRLRVHSAVDARALADARRGEVVRGGDDPRHRARREGQADRRCGGDPCVRQRAGDALQGGNGSRDERRIRRVRSLARPARGHRRAGLGRGVRARGDGDLCAPGRNRRCRAEARQGARTRDRGRGSAGGTVAGYRVPDDRVATIPAAAHGTPAALGSSAGRREGTVRRAWPAARTGALDDPSRSSRHAVSSAVAGSGAWQGWPRLVPAGRDHRPAPPPCARGCSSGWVGARAGTGAGAGAVGPKARRQPYPASRGASLE
jgi:hypothetical protein